jgi:hypothetical protein
MNIPNATSSDKTKKKTRADTNSEKFTASLLAQVKDAKLKSKEETRRSILRGS